MVIQLYTKGIDTVMQLSRDLCHSILAQSSTVLLVMQLPCQIRGLVSHFHCTCYLHTSQQAFSAQYSLKLCISPSRDLTNSATVGLGDDRRQITKKRLIPRH